MTDEREELEAQTQSYLVFFVTDGEAEQLRNLRVRNPTQNVFIRVSLMEKDERFRETTQVDLVFSSIFDLVPDVYY